MVDFPNGKKRNVMHIFQKYQENNSSLAFLKLIS